MCDFVGKDFFNHCHTYTDHDLDNSSSYMPVHTCLWYGSLGSNDIKKQSSRMHEQSTTI